MTTAVRLDDAAGAMYGKADLEGITSDLVQIGTEGYQQRLTEIGYAVGLTPGTLEPSVEEKIAATAARNAASIVATHNNDLSRWIGNNPDGDIAAWEAARADWKGRQVAFNETMLARNAADTDFRDRNGLADVEVQVVPEEAACDICQEYVDRGWMSQDEADDIDLPAHINCQHGLAYSDAIAGALTESADVWLGRWTDETDGPTWFIDRPQPPSPGEGAPEENVPAGATAIPADRKLAVGTTLVASYQGQTYTIEVVANAAGDGVLYRMPDGRTYASLSAAATAITGNSVNGWKFFGVQSAPPKEPVITSAGATAIADRNLQPGQTLVARYNGQDYVLHISGTPGQLTYGVEGVGSFSSLSAAARGITGNSVNGWKFWMIPSGAGTAAPPAAPTPTPKPEPTPGGVTKAQADKIRNQGPLPSPATWYAYTPDEQAEWLRQYGRFANPAGDTPDNVWRVGEVARSLGSNPKLKDWQAAPSDVQWSWQRIYPNPDPTRGAWVDRTGHARFEAPDGTAMPTEWSTLTRYEQQNWLADHTPADWRYSQGKDAGAPPPPEPRPNLRTLRTDVDVAPSVKEHSLEILGDLDAKYPGVAQRIQRFSSYEPEAQFKSTLDRAYAWNGREGMGDYINIHPKWSTNASEFRYSLASSESTGFGLPFHPIGTGNYEGVVAHEYGHSVERYLDDLSRRDATVRDHWTSYKNQMVQYVDISQYGKSSFAEQFAESFSAYFMHNYEGTRGPQTTSTNEIDTKVFMDDLATYLRTGAWPK